MTAPEAGVRPAGPLEGLRVADFTTMLSGPYCTRLLADAGAEVIKVEAPDGDHIRHAPPLRDGMSSYFGHLNSGKRSLVLDLKAPRGKAVARDLIAACDVVVENFRPGVMQRLGLDYDSLQSDMPRLVYCAISGFGQTGPRAAQPAYAPIVHALSGHDMTHLRYQDDIDRPAKSGIFTADIMSGTFAFGAIQTALLGRARSGRGQFVDLSLLDTMLNLLIYEVQEAQFPVDRRRALYTPMRAQDGYVIVAMVNQRNFEQVAAAVGQPDWVVDPRFRDVAARLENWELLMQEIERWTIARPAAACESELMAAGVPCARYLTVAEAIRDPQVAARGLMAEVQDESGSFLVPNPPFRFADDSIAVRPRVPALGADGAAILQDLLGYDPATIAALRDAGVLGG
ncbi:MAG: CaiB/BaiF CoA-transferase family protein [Sneathiellaceae bacterium]